MRGDRVKMITCPNCARKFNWWQKMIGEYKEHLSHCHKEKRDYGEAMATGCRGCPAVCFENASETEEKSKVVS
jgi:hypothetical protein